MRNGYYSNIETLPLQAWIDCNAGDLTATRTRLVGKEGNYLRKIGRHSAANDLKAWESIYNDFIEKVGFSPEYAQLIDLVKERAQLQIDYMKEKKDGKRIRFKLNRINELTSKIEKILKDMQEATKNAKKGTVTDNLMKLSKMQGIHLRIADLTTAAYFSLMKTYTENGR